jgi:hypothetical protein
VPPEGRPVAPTPPSETAAPYQPAAEEAEADTPDDTTSAQPYQPEPASDGPRPYQPNPN